MRDKHVRKTQDNSNNPRYRYNQLGEAVVPETEHAEKGYTKFSMDYMIMNSEDGDKANSTMVLVNHEDGGIFSYATRAKGIQGDSYWFPKRIAKDI